MEPEDSSLGKDQNFLHDQMEEERDLNSDDKQRDKGTNEEKEGWRTYAVVTVRRNILSLDFALKKQFNISPAYLGKFCMKYLSIKKKKLMVFIVMG